MDLGEIWPGGTTSLGVLEKTVVDEYIEDNVGVLVTNRRVLGFSAFTGGFFSQDLPSGNPVQEVQTNDNVVIIHLLSRKFVFRSGLAIWAELP